MLYIKKYFSVFVLLVLCKSALFPVSFVKIADSPEIYVCEHFLSPHECDAIIEKAKPSLTRSTVIDNNSSKRIVDTRRTSSGTFLSQHSEIPAVKKIRRYAEEITGLPKKNGEGLQVLHYSIGAEYQPHYDYFDPNTAGGLVHFKRGGQRVATLLVYLNTPEKGGETIFPNAKISITPSKGKALLFYNVDKQNNPTTQSLHGGAPVLSGEKWIATLWLREDTFK